MSDFNIILMATAWGPRHGGINAFNRDFAIGLAHALGERGRVFCAVLDPTVEDEKDALKRHVTLAPLHGKGRAEQFDSAWPYEIVAWLKEHHEAPPIAWWVGHDVISGQAALAGPRAGGGGRTALIHHMSYIAYQGVKHDDATDADAKDRAQKELFRSNDAKLFAVGPLLEDSCRRLAGDDRPVTMLAPGFPELPSLRPDPDRIVAVSFGRMDAASDRIKQGQLSVAGFGAALKTAHDSGFCPPVLEDPRFSLIGLPDSVGQEAEAARKLMESHAGRVVNVLPLPYDEKRARLFERLAEANMAFMLSWHEGFGLTGWEAIAAELPLIVSEQSGLYKLLNEMLSGAASGYVHPIKIEGKRGKRGKRGGINFSANDLENVSRAVGTIAKDLPGALTKARELKKQLKQKITCTWEHTGQQFLDGLGIGGATPVPPISPVPSSGGVWTTNNGASPSGTAGKAEGLSDALRSRSREQRFNKLKDEIGKALQGSSHAMGLLEAALNITPHKTAEWSAGRVAALRDSLLAVDFNKALDALKYARDQIDSADVSDRMAVKAIADVSAWLLPWLHIDDLDIDCDRLEKKDLGEIVALPAEIHSFADIIMAGIDVRMVQFEAGAKSMRWPRSPFSFQFGTPESGIGDERTITVADENNIRMAIAKALDTPIKKMKSGLQKIDDSINDSLEYFLDDKGLRWYIICEDYGNEEENVRHRQLMAAIADRYKKLAVINLADIEGGYQRKFDHIRRLLDLGGE